MPTQNTHALYGGVTKTFHWLTALAILSAFVLGLIAIRSGTDTPDQLARTVQLFSLHKTIGILAFFVALLRIIWALTQVKPGLLNADNKPEAFMAELVHWLLYGSMVCAPLAGWLHHAATEGFAPVLLPLGDNLFFIPKDPTVAAFFSGMHYVLVIVLGVSILAHVGGALKHAFIDRDDTLRRMLPNDMVPPHLPLQNHSHLPLIAAIVIYIGALGAGAMIGLDSHSHDHGDHDHGTPALAAVPSGWTVTEGTLDITIGQFGTDVTGGFADWTAAIEFDETAGEDLGSAEVTINIASLTLGSVTNEALGTDYFNAADFPTATFAATLHPDGDAYIARGTLTLRGVTADLDMPFTLALDGDTAVMSGTTVIPRLDYGVGAATTEESTLGLNVAVNVALTATRGG